MRIFEIIEINREGGTAYVALHEVGGSGATNAFLDLDKLEDLLGVKFRDGTFDFLQIGVHTNSFKLEKLLK